MLNIPTSKNGEALHIPLNNAAFAALKTVYQRGLKTGRAFQSRKTGEALFNSRHWFDKAVERAGILSFVWHDLRHCFAKLGDIGEFAGTQEFDDDETLQPPRAEPIARRSCFAGFE
jgi:integrase